MDENLYIIWLIRLCALRSSISYDCLYLLSTLIQSGLYSLVRPPVLLAHELYPIVESAFASLPELYLCWRQAVPSPVWRSLKSLLILELLLCRFVFLFESRLALDGLALP